MPQEFVPTLRAIGGDVRADAAETMRNPRARSAVLRVAEKIDAGLLPHMDVPMPRPQDAEERP
jgi:hypothetical protein